MLATGVIEFLGALASGGIGGALIVPGAPPMVSNDGS